MTEYKMLYEKDLRHAKAELKHLKETSDVMYLDGACFYTQQAIEKYFKLKLETMSIAHKSGHNLKAMADLMKSNNIEYDTRLDSYLREISSWATETRYSKNFIASTSELELILSIFEEALSNDKSIEIVPVKTNIFIK